MLWLAYFRILLRLLTFSCSIIKFASWQSAVRIVTSFCLLVLFLIYISVGGYSMFRTRTWTRHFFLRHSFLRHHLRRNWKGKKFVLWFRFVVPCDHPSWNWPFPVRNPIRIVHCSLRPWRSSMNSSLPPPPLPPTPRHFPTLTALRDFTLSLASQNRRLTGCGAFAGVYLEHVTVDNFSKGDPPTTFEFLQV